MRLYFKKKEEEDGKAERKEEMEYWGSSQREKNEQQDAVSSERLQEWPQAMMGCSAPRDGKSKPW